jgi:hypothetical protein
LVDGGAMKYNKAVYHKTSWSDFIERWLEILQHFPANIYIEYPMVLNGLKHTSKLITNIHT